MRKFIYTMTLIVALLITVVAYTFTTPVVQAQTPDDNVVEQIETTKITKTTEVNSPHKAIVKPELLPKDNLVVFAPNPFFIDENNCLTEEIVSDSIVEENLLEKSSNFQEDNYMEEPIIDTTNFSPDSDITDFDDSTDISYDEYVIDTIKDESVEIEIETIVSENYDTTLYADMGSTIRQQILDIASEHVGVTPYVSWYDRLDENGAIMNSLDNGTDCSVSLVMGEVGIDAPTGSDIYQNMANVSYEDLQPGDIVVYRNGSHVAIYEGDDRIIHCANEDLGTIESDMFYENPTGYVSFVEEN